MNNDGESIRHSIPESELDQLHSLNRYHRKEFPTNKID